MTNLDRTLGPWTAPGLGLATGTWAMNGVKAASSDSAPSTDVVLVAVSLIMTGVAVGVTVNVVLGLLLRSRRPEYASVDEAMLWMLPTGICVLGLAVWPLLEGSLATIDWVLLVVGSLASGFILGLVSGTSIRRHITASSRPGGPPLTRSHY
jgi:energy-converting hydrogenase Eha subunit A